jgi:hypothetical protein
MASANSTFTDLVTTTLRNHPSEVSDAVSGHNALYNRLQKRGKLKKTVSGGYEIVKPLDIAENQNYQRYSGFDTLSILQSDTLSAAKYDWVQAAVSIVASGRELRQNNSKEKLIDLMKARTKNAIRTAANNMSVDLYSSGALTNQMGGLAHLIQTDGTGTVGGIVSGTYTNWMNQFKEATGTSTYADIKNDMLALWMLCVRGTDAPDLIVSTHDLYKAYWDSLTDNQRYRNVEDIPDTFQSIKFQSADVMFDSNSNFTATGEKMYFVNSDYLELVVHSDADWTPLEEKTSVNQDAAVVTMIWMGQLVTSNRARQGVLLDAS